MLKRILAISAIYVATFSTCFAGAQFYIAPGVGYEDVRTKHNSRFDGLFPRLAIGYGGYFYPWLVLMGEVFGSYRTIDLNNEPKFGYSVKTNANYGISLLLGYALEENLLPYLRLGLIWNDFDKLDTTKKGYEIGIGLQTNLNCNWDVRGEWDYIKTKEIDNVGEVQLAFFAIDFMYRFG
jgi:opacity protein-like surface antigen